MKPTLAYPEDQTCLRLRVGHEDRDCQQYLANLFENSKLKLIAILNIIAITLIAVSAWGSPGADFSRWA